MEVVGIHKQDEDIVCTLYESIGKETWLDLANRVNILVTFDLAEDVDGNVMSMDEITSDITINAT